MPITQDSNLSPANAAVLAKELVQEMLKKAATRENAIKRAADRQQKKLHDKKQSQ